MSAEIFLLPGEERIFSWRPSVKIGKRSLVIAELEDAAEDHRPILWWCYPVEQIRDACVAYCTEPLICDSHGPMLMGDQFWDLAGDWDWRQAEAVPA